MCGEKSASQRGRRETLASCIGRYADLTREIDRATRTQPPKDCKCLLLTVLSATTTALSEHPQP